MLFNLPGWILDSEGLAKDNAAGRLEILENLIDNACLQSREGGPAEVFPVHPNTTSGVLPTTQFKLKTNHK